MAGRPKFFETPEQFQAKVDEYFAHCVDGETFEYYDKKRQCVHTVRQQIPMTVVDLALFLGFNSRQSLRDYEQRDKTENLAYAAIVTRAIAEIEGNKLRKSLQGVYSDRIAALDLASNHGYSTKAEVEVKSDNLMAILQDIHKDK